MKIHIEIDTEKDYQDLTMARVLAALTGEEAAPVKTAPEPEPEAKPEPKKATAPKKAAASAKKTRPTHADPEPEPEPEAEETEEGGNDLKAAVDLATKLISEGRLADVKKTLKSLGVSRVSELDDDNVEAFITALG